MKDLPFKFPQFSFLLIISCIFLSTIISCKKAKTGINSLPPATQEGNDTFGCLVNGVAFTPKGSALGGPILSSYYQYLNSPTAQGYFFNVSASRKNGGENGTESISINSNNRSIEQGQTYTLKNSELSGEIYGNYGLFKGAEINNYSTTNFYKGELNVSKFDETNQIVSGTFWFDAVNDSGEKVEVREGRFVK
ncbi:hypothetical protein ACVWYG_003818 [Pedobacter sp. UYEF25]